MTDDAGAHDTPDPEVGSLAEEAAKLFGTLSGWAREQGAEVGHGLSDAARHTAAAAHEVDEHFATGSAECTVCPVCRTMHAVRGLSPEVRSHLTTAVTSLAHAASAFLATQPPGPGSADTPRRGAVEHIDLDDDATPSS